MSDLIRVEFYLSQRLQSEHPAIKEWSYADNGIPTGVAEYVDASEAEDLYHMDIHPSCLPRKGDRVSMDGNPFLDSAGGNYYVDEVYWNFADDGSVVGVFVNLLFGPD